MTTIAIVDDELNILSALKRTLRREGWEIITYSDPLEAAGELSHIPCDLIISDYRMPGMTGVELLQQLKISQPNALRIILSGQSDMNGVLDAINQAEVYRFILKPWNNEELTMTLQNALRYADLLAENEKLLATIKAQKSALLKQEAELSRLEKESPGITKVDLDANGMIDLSNDYVSED